MVLFEALQTLALLQRQGNVEEGLMRLERVW
jgi:hypothetical protein